jgi:uncharacterized membrane protein HdeD (DUF308 family)
MADTPTPTLDDVDRRPRAARWWVHLVFGIVLAGLGVVLVVDPRAAASTLALLVGLSLVIHGIDDLLMSPRRGAGLVAGVASIIAGIVALTWPGVTLWVLAVITGMAFIAIGSLKVTTGLLARGETGWSWVVLSGVASAVLGILALSWPAATALVLALVLGIRTLMAGLTEIAFAVMLHRDPPPG